MSRRREDQRAKPFGVWGQFLCMPCAAICQSVSRFRQWSRQMESDESINLGQHEIIKRELDNLRRAALVNSFRNRSMRCSYLKDHCSLGRSSPLRPVRIHLLCYPVSIVRRGFALFGCTLWLRLVYLSFWQAPLLLPTTLDHPPALLPKTSSSLHNTNP